MRIKNKDMTMSSMKTTKDRKKKEGSMRSRKED